MRLVMKTFIVGGFFIIIAFVLERLVATGSGITDQILNAYRAHIGIWPLIIIGAPLIAWAMIEELVKYIAAYIAALKNKSCDEPVDMMIYLVTAALGFSAIENFLFLLNVLVTDGTSSASFLFTGNLRFLGATLLHSVTSAIFGAFLSFAFTRSKITKTIAWILGFIMASALHVLFNFFIIVNEGGDVLRVLICLWAVAMFVIFLFEIVKRLSYGKIITRSLNQSTYV